MAERGIDREPYAWSRDLHRYGTVPQGGFALGFERSVARQGPLQRVRRDPVRENARRREVLMRTTLHLRLHRPPKAKTDGIPLLHSPCCLAETGPENQLYQSSRIG
jgi:hypothetical protein